MSMSKRNNLKNDYSNVEELFPETETETDRSSSWWHWKSWGKNTDGFSGDKDVGSIGEVFAADYVNSTWAMIEDTENPLTKKLAVEQANREANFHRSELAEPVFSKKRGLEFRMKDYDSRDFEEPNVLQRFLRFFGMKSAENGDLFINRAKADHFVAKNLEISRRYSRFMSVYIGSAIASVVVVVAAIFVDFHIIKEFWHQAMVNEYMQLPPELGSSVWFKSLQVLFATIGIHLFLRILPNWARNIFVGFLFMITVVMMLSLGFMYAHNSLPNDNQALIEGRDTSNSGLGEMLTSMGLQPDASVAASERAAVELPAWMEKLAVYDAFGWMLSLSVIFFLVACIGALFLIWAEDNYQKFAVGRNFRDRASRTRHLRKLDALALQLK